MTMKNDKKGGVKNMNIKYCMYARYQLVVEWLTIVYTP